MTTTRSKQTSKSARDGTARTSRPTDAPTPTHGATAKTGSKTADANKTAQPLEKAKTRAGAVADEAKAQATQLAAEAQRHVTALTNEAREGAADAADRAKDHALSVVERQKTLAAAGVESIHQALDDASDRLRADGQSHLADYTGVAASRVQRLARYMQEHDLRDLTADAEALTRRHPEVVLGGLLVAGVTVARVLKSSARRRGPAEAKPLAAEPPSRGGSARPHTTMEGSRT